MTTFYKNYIALCAKKGKSASAVAQEIDLSRTSPNGWKKGKMPSDINMKKLADYFGVTVDDLLSEDFGQKENPTERNLSEVIPNYSDLTPDNQKKVRDFIDALLTVQQTQ